jgi:hypothetical protein
MNTCDVLTCCAGKAGSVPLPIHSWNFDEAGGTDLEDAGNGTDSGLSLQNTGTRSTGTDNCIKGNCICDPTGTNQATISVPQGPAVVFAFKTSVNGGYQMIWDE